MRRTEGLYRHDGRWWLLPRGRAGDRSGNRRVEGRLRGLQERGPRHRSQVRPQDRRYRRLEGDTGRLGGTVPEGGGPVVLVARLAEDPRPGQAPQGGVRGRVPAGLGGVPRARPPPVRPTPASAPAVGLGRADGDGPGGRPGPSVASVPASRSRTAMSAGTAPATCW